MQPQGIVEMRHRRMQPSELEVVRMRWLAVLSLLTCAGIAASCTTVTTGEGDRSQAPPNPATATVTKEPPATVTTTVSPPVSIQPTGPATSCNYTDSRPTISRGSKGAAVQQAQCYLDLSLSGTQRVNLPITNGDFGPLTDGATRRFQQCAGITVDGQIGPQTWAYLVYWAAQPNYLC